MSKNEHKDATVTTPQVSLVTYTYNDGEFARELIGHSKEFTVQPSEIIVVDDGSSPRFTMVDSPENLRVIRFERNQGIPKAKAAGLSMASGEYLLSIDCDMRLAADWLERCLAHMEEPTVGMVGGAVENGSGGDLVSRYLYHFGDNQNNRHTGSVDFIPGCAFLMRQDVWDHAGGFLGHTEPVCEDHYLCNRLKRLGYQLFRDGQAKAWQLRQLSRTVLCRRMWRGDRPPIRRQAVHAVQNHGMQGLSDYLFGTLAAPMLERINEATRLREPLFVYLELLHTTYAVMDTISYLEERGCVNDSVRAEFVESQRAMFIGNPRILAMLHADMNAMGVGFTVDDGPVSTDSWSTFFLFSEPLRQSGMLSYLDTHGVSELIREEMEHAFDLSSRVRSAG